MYHDYLNELKINGKSASTLIYQESILKEADAFKKLPGWTKDDVNRFILDLQEKNKKSSVEVKKAIIKRFFTWAGEKEIVEHLKIKFPKNNLRREDILTVDDVNKMIEATESPMYKALIAFLFESGARINEALKVKVEDIQETDKGMIISVPQTKTGIDRRRGLYVYSSGYIRNHITYKGLGRADLLFSIKRPQAHTMLNKIAKKAGIDKPMSPHKFRHAQATDMVIRGYQESIIRKKLGWTDDSRMLSRYEHIVDTDVIDATAEKAGTDIPRQPMINIKQAESLKIADASLQMSKLSEENKANQEKIKFLEDAMTKILANIGTLEIGKEIMKDKKEGK